MNEYSTHESLFTKPQVIGFLKTWATTNEIIVKGCDYREESHDNYDGYEAKCVTQVVSQTETETEIVSELYIKNENADNPEYNLDLQHKATIQHYDSLENIKKEYTRDLQYYNFLKNMLITNYNYNLLEETTDYDEFGLEDDRLTNKRYRQARFSHKFSDDLTVREIKESIEDVLYYVKESLKDFDNMFYTWYRFFDNDNNLCCEIQIYQVIQ